MKKEVPNSISTARIDIETGLLSRKTDHTSIFEYFNTGSMPTEYTEQKDLYPHEQSDDTASGNESEELF